MDPLSHLLRSLRVSGGLFFKVRLRTPFAVRSLPAATVKARYAPHADHVLPFHVVTAGRIWFTPEGEAPVELGPGEVVVFPRGVTHAPADAPGREPVPVDRLEHAISGAPPTLDHGGEGPPSEAFCGFFTAAGKVFNPLLEALPPVMVFGHGSASRAWLSSNLQRAFEAMTDPRPGSQAMAERLTESLFMEIVRNRVQGTAATGWLAGLTDPLVAKALERLHREPGRAWTVDALAAEVHASRSALAERFTRVVGRSPMRYLTDWRMELAAQRLLDTDDPISEIADDVGYASEAAFNRAFHRSVGDPPARYRSGRRQG